MDKALEHLVPIEIPAGWGKDEVRWVRRGGLVQMRPVQFGGLVEMPPAAQCAASQTDR